MGRLALVFTIITLGTMLTLEYQRLTIKPWPPKAFEDAEMNFKYGSIGAEVTGYPYLIWRELPEIFKDRLPGGFAEFGFIQEKGQELPIGVSVRRYGVNRVGFNCSTCHTSTVSYEAQTQLIYGAPANQLDLQGYIQFLAQVSTDERLTADAVFESAEANGRPFNFLNKLVFRYMVFPRLGEEVSQFSASLAWMKRRPRHGPGRTDAGNFWRARWGLKPENDEIVGAVDHPAVWNQKARLNGWFHWDGNNGSLDERNISAALAGGAAEWLLERQSIGRVSDWLVDLKSPAFPGRIDAVLAAQGEAIYNKERCGECHGFGGAKLGRVTPVDILKTDPDRSDLFSEEMVKYFGTVGELYSWHFQNYRTTDGYLNMPLDGIWARGPYLHNGSIPTLEALLTPSEDRPKIFIRGCNVLDPLGIGFNCEQGFKYDTSLRGNHNGGHEYGTTLPPPEKTALLEYLKTL